MNVKNFSDAMNELDGKYIEEALFYNAKAKKSRPFHRLPSVLVAAVLAAVLMGAGVATAVYGDNIQNWFGHYWEILTGTKMNDKQIEVIDRLSQNVDMSQELGDLTVTVDSATLGRDSLFLLVRVQGITFSEQYRYSFENITMQVTQDVTPQNISTNYGVQFQGLDSDGTALFLIDYSYVDDITEMKDGGQIDVTLTLENFLQNANTDQEKILQEGKCQYTFSLERTIPLEAVQLPDTEIMMFDLGKKTLVPITIYDVQLTSTGLSFRYDYSEGVLSYNDLVDIVLKDGTIIHSTSGTGATVDDSTVSEWSYQWQIPVNLEDASDVIIGEIEIPVSLG